MKVHSPPPQKKRKPFFLAIILDCDDILNWNMYSTILLAEAHLSWIFRKFVRYQNWSCFQTRSILVEESADVNKNSEIFEKFMKVIELNRMVILQFQLIISSQSSVFAKKKPLLRGGEGGGVVVGGRFYVSTIVFIFQRKFARPPKVRKRISFIKAKSRVTFRTLSGQFSDFHEKGILRKIPLIKRYPTRVHK